MIRDQPNPKTEKEIAKAIIMAQVASDGGKGIEDICRITHKSYPYWYQGYNAKDDLIIKAISLINKSKNSAFRYHVWKGDLYGWSGASCIVYFETTFMGDQKLQVSFHTFDERVKRFILRRFNRGYKTEWNELLGGSREDVITLASRYLR